MAEGLEEQARARAGSRAAVLAWGMCAFALALISASLVLALLGTARVVGLDFPLVGVSGALVGGLGRLPQASQSGRMVLSGRCLYRRAAGVGRGLRHLRADRGPGSVPLASLSAWFSSTFQIVGPIFGFVLLPLYFPTGRPPTPRWRRSPGSPSAWCPWRSC